jgi:hypothetical protein
MRSVMVSRFCRRIYHILKQKHAKKLHVYSESASYLQISAQSDQYLNRGVKINALEVY